MAFRNVGDTSLLHCSEDGAEVTKEEFDVTFHKIMATIEACMKIIDSEKEQPQIRMPPKINKPPRVERPRVLSLYEYHLRKQISREAVLSYSKSLRGN